ncbi:COG3179 Predicted chitinase [uncultured Caudovirales phage]|uniref:COG3179 Predicted chitinase n=1 Tax=uncultured Caudovirales phage TaxID=2100421 RepID=A0A6J7WF69_9CAUD|nr:COG3179 Predicted chitinase [uncultured Caudovirales phage]
MLSKQTLIDSQTCSADMAEKWFIPLEFTCEKFDINTPERLAGFLSQLSHESGGFRFTSENLNYRADALTRVWPSRFPPGIAESYAMQPEKIANRAYCDRMGNGDEASGDGWKYRGRGLIQLTGKDNYAAFSLDADNEALVNPDLVAEPELAALSAGWFWSKNGLNALADAKDIVGMTKRINGGTNGLDDRQMRYSRLMSVLS